ncbi:hypothetical protein [Caballeronia arationis]|uniref:hypothetical protein n=1 Tax=Caballeronia arationis TaxID=1777142 RepID=UPI0007874C76|nr:hypothetical protein [Caballeronia arationis]
MLLIFTPLAGTVQTILSDESAVIKHAGAASAVLGLALLLYAAVFSSLKTVRWSTRCIAKSRICPASPSERESTAITVRDRAGAFKITLRSQTAIPLCGDANLA